MITLTLKLMKQAASENPGKYKIRNEALTLESYNAVLKYHVLVDRKTDTGIAMTKWRAYKLKAV